MQLRYEAKETSYVNSAIQYRGVGVAGQQLWSIVPKKSIFSALEKRVVLKYHKQHTAAPCWRSEYLSWLQKKSLGATGTLAMGGSFMKITPSGTNVRKFEFF